MKTSFSKTVFAAIIVLPLALSACSTPSPSADSSSSDTASASAPTASGSSSSQSSAASADKNGSGPIENPKSELLVGVKASLEAKPEYAAQTPTCKATATRMILGTFGSMALVLGMANSKDVEGDKKKFADAVDELQGTTPLELDTAFSKLEGLLVAPSADADPAAVESDFKPISDWLTTNCDGFSTDS